MITAILGANTFLWGLGVLCLMCSAEKPDPPDVFGAIFSLVMLGGNAWALCAIN